MTNETAQQGFKGWAMVEMFGHQKIAGYVQTVSFGAGVMFQVDVPTLPQQESTTTSPGYIDGQWIDAGAVVRCEHKEGYTRLLGVGAIYAINPCTEEAAMLAVANFQRPEVKLIAPPPARQIAAAESDDEGGAVLTRGDA